MKRISLLFIFLLTLTFQAFAQDDPNRLASTKILDALNALPAENQQAYDKYMSDIASTGSEGIQILINKLLTNDESLSKVEYALNGYTAYAASTNFDASKRQILLDAINSTIKGIDSKLSGDPVKDAKENPALLSNKKFLERQLMVLGQKKVTIEPRSLKSADELIADIKTAYNTAKKEGSYSNKAVLNSALHDYIQVVGVTGAEKTILSVLKDKSRDYRFAAINAVNEIAKENEVKALFSKINPSKYSDETIQDIMYWFSSHPESVDCSIVTPLLESKNIDVVTAAAWTLTKIGNSDNVKDLAALIASSDDARISLGESCLKSFKGNVTDAVSSLQNLTTNGQISVINLIAARHDRSKCNIIYDALNSSDAQVKGAAYGSLTKIAGKDDLKNLYSILESADKENISDVQNGINTALAEIPAKDRFTTIEKQKTAAGKEKENLYWPILFKNATNLQLLDICNNLAKGNDAELKSLALQAYIATIPSNATGEQKLIMLRNAMEFAQTDAEKIQILGGVAKTGTFLGFMFAGSYINEPALQQAAAQALRVIATSNKTIYGTQVQQLLEKAKEVITGQDSGYQKTEIQDRLNEMAQIKDEGFVSIFNGKDLTGWKGLLVEPYDNPYRRQELKADELEKRQKEANDIMNSTWSVENGAILFNGKGRSLCTEKQYGNFEMYVDWKLIGGPEPDAGIYLRGTPQVQIWDTSRVNVGAQVGSGGLYNNWNNRSTPLKVADNGVGQWNSFYIKMIGERVTVYLNGELVVNDIIMENYWNRDLPILMKEQIELQAHGSIVAYRDIYIHELPSIEPTQLTAEEKKQGFEMLFDGTSLQKWQGDKVNYTTDSEGAISVSSRSSGTGGNLYTKEQYSDFIFRFEFKLTDGANNGVGIRAEMGKDAAYHGMEIQILDHFNKIYQPGLHDYQYHGSVYGIIPTQDQHQLKPVGEWNVEEIYAKGDYIRVTLNGVVITEGNIREATKNGTYDGKQHPGLFNKTGYIGFLGHGSTLWLRNVRIKKLDK